MLHRRIIAVTPDRAFGQLLASALATVGGVEVHQSLDLLASGAPVEALWVIHVEGAFARAATEVFPRLPAGQPVIALLPRSDVAAVVDLMQSADSVAGVMVAQDFDGRQLATMASRILSDDVFGLDKTMAPGAQIHTQVVGDYSDKTRCLMNIAAFVEQLHVPRMYRESIEQCCDEMLMNALYDAPVDEHGKHIFAGVAASTRITLRTEQSVIVQYAHDGKQFALSVRDAFGTLERRTALSFLHKCLHVKQQVDRRADGAGVGLYLMLSSSTAVSFNVLPGIATEALCVFELENPNPQLGQCGFLVQRDPGNRRPTGPARRLPAAETRRGAVIRKVTWALGAALAAAIVLLGVVVWSHLSGGAKHGAEVSFSTIPKGGTIELDGRVLENEGGSLPLEVGRSYSVVARLAGYEAKQAFTPHPGQNDVTIELQPLVTVMLDSQPTGAVVEIDGKPMGSTPLTLTSLVPRSTVSIAFKHPGYRVATTRLTVPASGTLKHLVQPLEFSNELVRVHFVSTPPGAEVIQSGQLPTVDRTYTPAEVLVEAGQLQRFTLTMPNHVPVVIDPFTPEPGAQVLERGGILIPGVTLRIEATIEGKVSVAGAPHCKEVTLPCECTLAPNTYTIEYLGPTTTAVTHSVKVADRDLVEKLELGYVEAAPEKLLQPGGLRRAVFEVGKHTVAVSDKAGTHAVTVIVTVGPAVIAN